MINNYTKLAACIALMWLLPHCTKKSPPAKTIDPEVALSVQEDCLIIAIERRLNRLEAQTYQQKKEKPANAQPVPISASEAVNE
jgi:hypothetical protein